MDTKTPHHGIPFMWPGQARKEDVYNAAIKTLDRIVQPVFRSRTATSPTTTAEGARFIVPAGGTGDFAGRTNQIAIREGGQWAFYEPAKGWFGLVLDEMRRVWWTGTEWQNYGRLRVRDLADVDLTGIEDGDFLGWDADRQKWVPMDRTAVVANTNLEHVGGMTTPTETSDPPNTPSTVVWDAANNIWHIVKLQTVYRESLSLATLKDVHINDGVSNGDLLMGSGTGWTNAHVSSVAPVYPDQIMDLNDVATGINPPQPRDLLFYDSAAQAFVPGAPSRLLEGATLDNVSDVAITAPQDGDTLFWDAGNGAWVNLPIEHALIGRSLRKGARFEGYGGHTPPADKWRLGGFSNIGCTVFNTVKYDVGGWTMANDFATFNVPAGISRVRVRAWVKWGPYYNTTGGFNIGESYMRFHVMFKMPEWDEMEYVPTASYYGIPRQPFDSEPTQDVNYHQRLDGFWLVETPFFNVSEGLRIRIPDSYATAEKVWFEIEGY